MGGSFDTKKIFNRFAIIYAIFLGVGLIAIGRIIYLQYITKDKVTLDDIYRKETLQPSRGSILSHDGKPLAVSIPMYELRWDTSVPADSTYRDGIDELSRGLSLIFRDKSAAEYKADFKKAREKKNRYKKVGNRRVDFGELEKIKSLPIFNLGKFKGGLITIESNNRINPFGTLANRTIGFVAGGGAGTGIEFDYDYKLCGEEGVRTIHRMPGDVWIPVNGGLHIPAKDGLDIRTTIDVYIQEAAETELRNQLAMSDVFEGGTVIVMDVKTGAIRGIANMYKKKDGTFSESYNYAIEHPTEPGSTLKLAALMALLEDGYITLNTQVDAGNGEWKYYKAKITDTHHGGYGMVTAKEAFAKSSNIAFAKMVIDAYESNPSQYVDRLHNMKLFENLKLDIGGERAAYVTTPDDKGWSPVTLASLGYGYATTLTPLHTLTFYNAVANGGKMVRPYFIEDFEKDGIVYESHDIDVITGSICSKSTLKAAHEALRAVVTEGTATKCDDERYQIAGKTGTARIAMPGGGYEDSEGYRRHQASFAGYFPADNPRYSCIVVMYTGKTKGNFYGATWAAPIFKRVADKIFTSHPEWEAPIYADGLVPDDNPSIASGRASYMHDPVMLLPMAEKPRSLKDEGWVKVTNHTKDVCEISTLDIEHGVVPDVVGMGLKDAIYLLENEGYKVTFEGHGRVHSQSPRAGEALGRKGRISLYLK